MRINYLKKPSYKLTPVYFLFLFPIFLYARPPNNGPFTPVNDVTRKQGVTIVSHLRSKMPEYAVVKQLESNHLHLSMMVACGGASWSSVYVLKDRSMLFLNFGEREIETNGNHIRIAELTDAFLRSNRTNTTLISLTDSQKELSPKPHWIVGGQMGLLLLQQIILLRSVGIDGVCEIERTIIGKSVRHQSCPVTHRQRKICRCEQIIIPTAAAIWTLKNKAASRQRQPRDHRRR